MNTSTATKATSAASSPAAMLSAPSSGPMVRSSRKVISAGSAPARSKTASSVELSTVKLPEICPDPPVIACRITGAEITSFVQHDGKRRAHIGRRVFAERPRARRVEAEGHHRLPGLLVETRLAVRQVVARHDRRLFEDVEHPLLVHRRQDLLARPGLSSALSARPTTGWNVSRAVVPIRSFSSCAEPIPGTWIRIRSAPCRWIVGSRVPASSTRRRTISTDCCIVRSSVAARSASLRRDDQHVALPAHVQRRGADARQAHHRLRQLAHRRHGRRQPLGLAHPDMQLTGRRVDPADRADRVAQVPQRVPHLGPERIHPRHVDILDRDLGQQMRAAPQVEAQVHQRRGQELRPARQRRGVLLVVTPVASISAAASLWRSTRS
jgi:hypothetical protein